MSLKPADPAIGFTESLSPAKKKLSRTFKIFVLPVSTVYAIWLVYMISTNSWQALLFSSC